jgi:hypothetical protein
MSFDLPFQASVSNRLDDELPERGQSEGRHRRA